MHTHLPDGKQGSAHGHLFGPCQAWFAFAMTLQPKLVDQSTKYDPELPRVAGFHYLLGNGLHFAAQLLGTDLPDA